jgi:hypothetical protein
MKNGFGASITVGKPIITSVWDTVCTDKFGNLKWCDHSHNVVTNQGLQKLLDVMFLSGTQILNDDWYVLVTEHTHVNVLATSTYAVPVFTECVEYTGNRKLYVGVRTGQEISNVTSKAVFVMGASGTKDLRGGALVGGGSAAATVGDTAGGGTLYCSVDFAALYPVVPGDYVSIVITLTAAEIV